ncbi:epoxide hydrolase N-terminal domain-containing protein [Streptomyces sp. NPDC059697]|uniref:epoxide hydrolase N-terminal domain-containing protein n=1 Tax=Streptomyces sp. NPDC059697 TaxID=3346912 RepID=UPI003686AA34
MSAGEGGRRRLEWVAHLRELVAYWADGFDWSRRMRRSPGYPASASHFLVPLSGLGTHFVPARAAASAGSVLPLVRSHGWPDSFWRYAKVPSSPPPTHTAPTRRPGMPGYGYSDSPPACPST